MAFLGNGLQSLISHLEMISMVAISGSKSQITGSGPTIIVLETEFECFGDLTYPGKSTNFLALHYLFMITLT